MELSPEKNRGDSLADCRRIFEAKIDSAEQHLMVIAAVNIEGKAGQHLQDGSLAIRSRSGGAVPEMCHNTFQYMGVYDSRGTFLGSIQ